MRIVAADLNWASLFSTCFFAFRWIDFDNDFFYKVLYWLVVWLPSILFSQKYWVSIIIPIDELIFFRGMAQPPVYLNFFLVCLFQVCCFLRQIQWCWIFWCWNSPFRKVKKSQLTQRFWTSNLVNDSGSTNLINFFINDFFHAVAPIFQGQLRQLLEDSVTVNWSFYSHLWSIDLPLWSPQRLWGVRSNLDFVKMVFQWHKWGLPQSSSISRWDVPL